MKQHNCDLRLVKLAGAVAKRKQEIIDRNTPYHDHHNVKDAEQLEKLAKKSAEIREDISAKDAQKRLDRHKRQIGRILETAHKRSGADEDLYNFAKRIVHVVCKVCVISMSCTYIYIHILANISSIVLIRFICLPQLAR